ncbi:MAG: type II toxin-antitoxin system VapC family toxin [Planctomycetota bacterium]
MIVVDASVIVAILLRAEPMDHLAQRLDEARGILHAPHLLDVEVYQALRRFSLADEIELTRCAEAQKDFYGLPIIRYPHTDLLERAWELRSNLTIYDGIYVALAEALDAQLWTQDSKLAKAVRKLTKVKVLD